MDCLRTYLIDTAEEEREREGGREERARERDKDKERERRWREELRQTEILVRE